MSDDPHQPARTHRPESWRSPGGIGAMASVVGVLIAIIALVAGAGVVGQVPATTDDPSTYFFVYGTTMPGHLRYQYIEEFVAAATPDRVTGRLYDSGAGYPAAKFGGGIKMIEGFRLEIRPGREVEARRAFTSMESGLFDPVTIRTEAGFEVNAYEWVDSVEGFEELDGRWDRPEA